MRLVPRTQHRATMEVADADAATTREAAWSGCVPLSRLLRENSIVDDDADDDDGEIRRLLIYAIENAWSRLSGLGTSVYQLVSPL